YPIRIIIHVIKYVNNKKLYCHTEFNIYNATRNTGNIEQYVIEFINEPSINNEYLH
ncbi:10358_t:CDS:1, partial [Gigaspora margarita]